MRGEKRKGKEEMKRSVAVLLAVMLLCSAFLFSCSSPADRIVGRWETEISDEKLGNARMVYHFTEKGEIYLEQREGDTVPFSIPFGTWSVKGDRVTIESEGSSKTFTFSLHGSELTLLGEGEERTVFHRI
jgi:hypothetical protein